MKRALAALAAIAMVGAALWVRAGRDGREQQAAQPRRVVCSTELAAVCDALVQAGDLLVDTAVEPAATTADRLGTNTDPGIDAWIVVAPWPALVEQRRARAQLPPLFTATSPPVARARLGLVAWKDRAAALGCPLTWRCVGDAAGSGWAARGHPEWGPVKPGLPSPREATGLLALGQVVTSYFGRADVGTNDLDADDAFGGWFESLARAVPRFDDPLTRMLAQGRSAYDVVAATEADVRTVVATAARRDDVTAVYPAPMATADVVVATTAGGGPVAAAVRAGAARTALRESGWRTEPAARTGGNGLPDAGLLDALLTRWEQAR